MKKVVAIITKDLILRFTNLSEWLFFLILPIIFTVVLAGGTYNQDADNRIRVIVVDQAQSSLSEDLINALEDSDSVRPEVLGMDEAEKELSERRVSAMLIIPEGFDMDRMRSSGIELELQQQPNNTNAMVAERAVMVVLNQISSTVDIANQSTAEAEKYRPFASEAERLVFYEAALQEAQSQMMDTPERVISMEGNTPDQVEYDPSANSSAGQLITWVFIPLIAISELFAEERHKGTLKRIFTTPTRKGTYLFATILGQVLAALLQMALLVGFGTLVMKVNWGQDIGGLTILLICGALAAAAMGTMLGTFVKTTAQAQGLSIMLGMVMALMGGCWYPLELFPQIIQQIVKVLPTTWMMNGLLDLVIRGQGLIGILPEAAVLLGFSVVFFIVGIWRFRYE